MSERNVIDATPVARTRASLVADLQRLGVEPGSTLLVHSSLGSLGWVVGGAGTVIQALLDVLGPEGTLVMPAHSGSLSEPSEWENPPVPEAWWPLIRAEMPPFDPRTTPSQGMGVIAEQFRTWPDVLRSDHPCVSFCARGPLAAEITADHSLEYSLGERSPLGRLYELQAQTLLLGVDYSANTCFHLAEYRVKHTPSYTGHTPIVADGQRRWTAFADVDFQSERFPAIGELWDRTGAVRLNWVGSAASRLFSLAEAVDFAQQWLDQNPLGSHSPSNPKESDANNERS